MEKGRLEAFSDGVIAIIITIMVLEFKKPETADWHSLRELLPEFLGYLLSFVYVGIYWNNHHHLLKTVQRVNGSIMWANLHLLFWLSLLPFATGWMGEHPTDPITTVFYGIILLLAAMAYFILQGCIIAEHGRESLLAAALGKDWKGKLSPLIYLVALGFSPFYPAVAQLLYVLVAFVWLVPDRRIERVVRAREGSPNPSSVP
jgi:uncharacterized membrane protein